MLHNRWKTISLPCTLVYLGSENVNWLLTPDFTKSFNQILLKLQITYLHANSKVKATMLDKEVDCDGNKHCEWVYMCLHQFQIHHILFIQSYAASRRAGGGFETELFPGLLLIILLLLFV